MNKNLKPDLSGEAYNEWTDEQLTQILNEESTKTSPLETQQIIRDGSDYTDVYGNVLNEGGANPLEKKETPNYLADEPTETPAPQEPTPQEPVVQAPIVDPVIQEPIVEGPQGPEPEGDNVYSAAFEMLKTMGMIQGEAKTFENEEQFYALRDQTYRSQYAQAMENVIQGAHQNDPAMGQLVDYALRGGRFADVPKMQEIIQDEIDYLSAPIETPEEKHAYISDYLYYKGTPPEFIDSIIKDLQEGMQVDTKIGEAREFFAQKSQYEKQQEYQRAMALKQQEEQKVAYQRQQQAAWDQEFQRSLRERGWAQAKQQEIMQQYQQVPLQGGGQMPLHEYKMEMIRRDPHLFQEHLDWLAKFDAQTGSFSDNPNVSRKQENTIAQKIIKNLNKKTGSKVTGDPSQPRQQRYTPTANPFNEIR